MNEFEYNVDFERMVTKAQVMKWFEDILIPQLLPDKDYNGNALTDVEKGFVSVTNKRIGTTRIRAVKVKPHSCKVPSQLADNIKVRARARSSTAVDAKNEALRWRRR